MNETETYNTTVKNCWNWERLRVSPDVVFFSFVVCLNTYIWKLHVVLDSEITFVVFFKSNLK